MDQDLEQDIKNHFFKEYESVAIAKKSGWTGKLLRWSRKPTMGLAEKIGVAAATIAVTAAVIAGGLLFPLVACAAIIGAAVTFSAASWAVLSSVERAANKDMDKDINNRTLVTRYKNEVVDKKIQRLTDPAASLKALSQQLAELALKPEFDDASKNAAAAPAQSRRFSLHKQHTPA